jgi:putative transposase
MWTPAHREKYKYDDRRYPSDLTDAEWEAIKVIFSGYTTLTVDLREMVNACFYLERTGCPWPYLPKDFGPWETVRWWYDRFRADGIWAEVSSHLTRAVRKAQGHANEPSTGIMDSQSVVSAPQKGDRGFDGNKKIKGMKRHILTCSLGFILAVIVTAANVHDTKAVDTLLERATENGWSLERVNVDGIYVGPTVDAAAQRHGVDFQVATRDGDTKPQGFKPLPLRWRLEATFGTLSNRYRRLTRNWEETPKNSEDAVELANCHRLIRNYGRDILGQT